MTTVDEPLEPCDDCGAAEGVECEPYCPATLPTDDELTQDWRDVGAL